MYIKFKLDIKYTFKIKVNDMSEYRALNKGWSRNEAIVQL